MTTQATLYVDQGTSFLVSLELTETTGSDYVIGLESFRCDIKKLYSSSTLFSANVEVVTGDGGNDLNLYLDPAQTRDIAPGKYQYDVLMIEAGGGVTKLLEGLMIILPTVTSSEGS